jgi:hypothetical protein
MNTKCLVAFFVLTAVALMLAGCLQHEQNVYAQPTVVPTIQPTITATSTPTATITPTPTPTNTPTPTIEPTIASLVQPTLELHEVYGFMQPVSPEKHYYMIPISLSVPADSNLSKNAYYFTKIADTLGWSLADCQEENFKYECLKIGDTYIGSTLTQPDKDERLEKEAAGSLIVLFVHDKRDDVSMDANYVSWYFFYSEHTLEEKYYGKLGNGSGKGISNGEQFFLTFSQDSVVNHIGNHGFVYIKQVEKLTAEELLLLQQMNNK